MRIRRIARYMLNIVIQDRRHPGSGGAGSFRDLRMSDLLPSRDFLQSPEQDMLNLPFLGGGAGSPRAPANSSGVLANRRFELNAS